MALVEMTTKVWNLEILTLKTKAKHKPKAQSPKPKPKPKPNAHAMPSTALRCPGYAKRSR